MKWSESTCAECGLKMPSGLTRHCEKGGLCNWHIPAAVREHLERIKANHERMVQALKAARFNIAYAHQPENCGDHCRNSCRDCVLKNTLEDIDVALAELEPK